MGQLVLLVLEEPAGPLVAEEPSGAEEPSAVAGPLVLEEPSALVEP